MTPTRAELEQLAQSPDGRRRIDALAGNMFCFLPTIVWGAGHEGEDGWYVSTHKWGPFKDKGDIEKWIAEHPVIHGKPVVLQTVDDWPDFTTSIADAWQLVEKMRGDGWFYDLGDHIQTSEHFGRFFTPFHPPGGKIIDVHFIAATAPRAITIAAIMAKREENNGHL